MEPCEYPEAKGLKRSVPPAYNRTTVEAEKLNIAPADRDSQLQNHKLIHLPFPPFLDQILEYITLL